MGGSLPGALGFKNLTGLGISLPPDPGLFITFLLFIYKSKSMGKLKVVAADEKSATITVEGDDLQQMAMNVGKLQKKYSIKKAKLKDIALEVEYSETLDDSSNKVKKDCTAPVHEDLKQAFQRMNNLLRDITEQPDDSNVECTGFTIGNNEDGATLIGFRDLESGSVLNLTAPYSKFEDIGELDHAITIAKQEVLLYLFEKKHAPEQQLSLFDNETDIEEDL